MQRINRCINIGTIDDARSMSTTILPVHVTPLNDLPVLMRSTGGVDTLDTTTENTPTMLVSKSKSDAVSKCSKCILGRRYPQQCARGGAGFPNRRKNHHRNWRVQIKQMIRHQIYI